MGLTATQAKWDPGIEGTVRPHQSSARTLAVPACTNGYKSDHTVGLSRTEGRESAVLAIDAEIPRRCV